MIPESPPQWAAKLHPVGKNPTKFDRDRDRAEASEVAICKLLHVSGYRVERSDRCCGKWDIKWSLDRDPSKFATCEVKHDLKAVTTGNHAMEISHSGRPSGLNTTTADFWVAVVDRIAWRMWVTDLRRFVGRNQDRLRVVRCGDGLKAECVLVPLKDLEPMQWCERFDMTPFWPAE